MTKEYDFLQVFYEILENKRRFPEQYSWEDVISVIEKYQNKTISQSYCRDSSKFLYQFLDNGWRLIPPEPIAIETSKNVDDEIESKQTVSFNGAKNEYTYNGIIDIFEGEAITPELLMRKHNIDPSRFKVTSYRNAMFRRVRNDDGSIIDRYTSSVGVKPIETNETTFADVERWFEEHKCSLACKPKCEKFCVDNSSHSKYLHIDLTDLHIGLLSWDSETGENFDIQIATDRVKKIVDDLINKVKDYDFKGVTIATLGDILHVDNINNTTTHGTSQDVDGRITKIFDHALDLMMYVIDRVSSLGVPIKYIYVNGNHDTGSGAMLALSLRTIYRLNPNIEFDVSPNPQKAVRYGATLIGLTHGDTSPKHLATWLANDYRRDFGECKYAQIHCGHLHEFSVNRVNNVEVYRLPALCGPSQWEHERGYRSDRALMSFVYDENTGMSDMINLTV